MVDEYLMVEIDSELYTRLNSDEEFRQIFEDEFKKALDQWWRDYWAEFEHKLIHGDPSAEVRTGLITNNAKPLDDDLTLC